MPARKGLLAPQNTFLDTIATRFDGTHSNFVLGNARIANVYPIVYCSDGFVDLTGFTRAEIMQKSCACHFLYGPKTDVQVIEDISRALKNQEELKLEVILYKKTHTPFWCLLDIVPIQDEKHEVVFVLCSHKDITKQKLHQQQQRVLAELHAQKQQLASAATAAATNAAVGAGGGAEQLEGAAHHGPRSPGAAQKEGHAEGQLEQAKLGEADEAELTRLANQTALSDMGEFELDESGEEGDLFDEVEETGSQDKQTAKMYSRRRSRAVLYNLSGHYSQVNMKSKLKLNNRMNLPEYKTTTIEKQRFILSHYGVGKSCWDWLILVVSFYVAIVVPYNATFKDKHQDLTGECQIDSIDILVEVVFVIDVILNFRTTFVNRKGEVVTRPKIICKHYVRGWFVVDACAALPFDLLCSLNLYSRSRLDLNLLKLIRLLRLARLLQKMDRYSQYSYIILTLLMLIFSLLAHWCACIWYVIAMEEIERNPPDWKIGWIHQLSDKLGYSVVNTTDMASSYVTALYFTTSSLTSVGFGNVSANTNAEKIFSIVIMLIGALMHAVVFGNVTALIRVMYARRSNYQTRLRDLKDFFRLHQLPKELQQRMSDYFQTTWSLNHGIETYEILRDFPEELRGDVSLHLHREVLSLPIFELAPQGFLKSLARHIESKFCCPTEYLIHRGDALNYLYLVCNGSMEVLQDNMVVAILGKGDLVGYDVPAIKAGYTMPVGLIKSSSDLKALTYCDLKCIHITGLLEVLKLYPEFSDVFHEEILHDLSFNLREQHEEGNAMLLAPGGSGGGGGGGDDEDEDDDEQPDEDPRSPPPNMRHLHRSITATDNQIGRYDHDDQEDRDEDDDDDDGQLEEEEEEEEILEEEEEEELHEDKDDSNEDDDHEDDQGGAPSAGHDFNDEPADSTGHDQNRRFSGSSDGSVEGRKPVERSGLANGVDGVAESTRSSGVQGLGRAEPPSWQADEFSSPGAQGAPSRVEHANKPLRGGPRRRQRPQMCQPARLSTTESMAMAAAAAAATNENLAAWQTSQSYDGAEMDSRLRAAATARGRLPKNNSDELLSETRAVAARPKAAEPIRLRSAIGRPNQTGALTRKPPLSFDLSRNTTTLVDCRRRSAGCILRAQTSGGQSTFVAGHSSLIHINEEQTSLSSSASSSGRRDKVNANGQRNGNGTQLRDTCKTAPVSVGATKRASKLLRNNRGQSGQQVKLSGSNSNHELRSMNARLSGLSASVSEMKEELRQFGTSMQLLMHLVDRQTLAANLERANIIQSTTSLASGVRHSASRSPSASSRQVATAATEAELAAAPSPSSGAGKPLKPPLPRSLSTTSLVSGQLSSSAPQGATAAAARNARIRHQFQQQEQPPASTQPVLQEPRDEGADTCLLTGGATMDAASLALDCLGSQMDPLRPQVEACETQAGRPLGGQHLSVGQVAGNVRAISQCSSSPMCSRQSGSGANLNSDNDSGRSSSSMNSSSFANQRNQQRSSNEQPSSQGQAKQLIVQTDLSAYQTLPLSMAPQQAMDTPRTGIPATVMVTLDANAQPAGQHYSLDLRKV